MCLVRGQAALHTLPSPPSGSAGGAGPGWSSVDRGCVSIRAPNDNAEKERSLPAGLGVLPSEPCADGGLRGAALGGVL